MNLEEIFTGVLTTEEVREQAKDDSAEGIIGALMGITAGAVAAAIILLTDIALTGNYLF